jgi:uncharacterized protein YecT (DUF1311 family)
MAEIPQQISTGDRIHMTTKRLVAALLFSMMATQACGATKDSCYDTAKTQFELNECAAGDLKEADDELNRVYREILKRNAHDAVFLERLKSAQRAWISFRDAELEALFPDPEKQVAYGSAYPMCYANWKKKITVQRTQQLRKWLTGTEEGDVCTGSLPIR